MKMTRWSVLLLLLLSVACLSLSRRLVSGEPSFVTDTGVSVYLNGTDAGLSDSDISAVVDRVYYEALSGLCPSDRWPAFRAAWTGTYLQFRARPFPCGKRMVGGCVYNGTAYVDGIDLVPDELSHVVFSACFDRSGELELPDGGAEYDADFNAFLHRVEYK